MVVRCSFRFGVLVQSPSFILSSKPVRVRDHRRRLDLVLNHVTKPPFFSLSPESLPTRFKPLDEALALPGSPTPELVDEPEDMGSFSDVLGNARFDETEPDVEPGLLAYPIDPSGRRVDDEDRRRGWRGILEMLPGEGTTTDQLGRNPRSLRSGVEAGGRDRMPP